jgi:hypothetical protein
MVSLKKKIVLDNNAVNWLVDGVDHWSKSRLGHCLQQLVAQDKIEVYAIPTNVVEIALCTDFAKRKRLAVALNELISGIRMHQSWEFDFLNNFFKIVDSHWPGSFKSEIHYGNFNKDTSKIFLCLLAQLAHFENYPIGSFSGIIKAKLYTKFYQARLLSDPEYFLELYLQEISGQPLPPDVIANEKVINSYEIEELKNKTNEFLENRKQIKNIQRYQKVKEKLELHFNFQIAREILKINLPFKEQIEDTIDFVPILTNWQKPSPIIPNEIQSPLNPEILRIHDDPNQSFSKEGYYTILELLLLRFGNGFLFPIDAMLSSYFSEIELLLNSKRKLTEGTSLDLDYIPALFQTDYFISGDFALRFGISRVLNKYRGNTRAKILSNTDQSIRVLSKL